MLTPKGAHSFGTLENLAGRSTQHQFSYQPSTHEKSLYIQLMYAVLPTKQWDMEQPQPQIQIAISSPSSLPQLLPVSILTRVHAGYFRITVSLCTQALLWKTLSKPSEDLHALRHIAQTIPSAASLLLWSISLITLAILSIVYTLRCYFYLSKVKAEFLDHVGVNYLFTPWISWLLLLESAPLTFLTPKASCYLVLWWVFALPVLALDVQIYGQWFTKGKRFLLISANPTSQISVIGNLVGASVAAEMGWKEIAVCLFSLGMAHYLVLFVTLYQRFAASDKLPALLRPVFFLFFAAPSMASLAWKSISGTFDIPSKMLFFLSLFLLASLISRPWLFRKSMRKFNVAWWAYSYPVTVMAQASAEYAAEVKSRAAHILMLVLAVISVLVTLPLLLFTFLNTSSLFREDDPALNEDTIVTDN